MSAIRVPSGAASASPPTGQIPGARESKLSRYFLLWLPAAPFVGFTLAEAVFDLGGEGDWELWKAALLGSLLMAPFAVGAYFGLRSVLKGYRGGWVGLAANLVLGVLAIGMTDRGVPHRLTAELAQGYSASTRLLLPIRCTWVDVRTDESTGRVRRRGHAHGPGSLRPHRRGGSAMSCPKVARIRGRSTLCQGSTGREHCTVTK